MGGGEVQNRDLPSIDFFNKIETERKKKGTTITKNCSILITKALDSVSNKTCKLFFKQMECIFVSKFSGFSLEYNSCGEHV